MRIETDMPLSSLIEKLLREEAAEFHDEDFRTYVDSKMGNNHELLQQALNEIEDAIDNWKCSYFISVYDERVNAYRTVLPNGLHKIWMICLWRKSVYVKRAK